MRVRLILMRLAWVGLPLALLGIVPAGCQTAPKIDWDSRVGTHTYDQAVSDLGPPDKSAKLSDGKTVAEWISRRSDGMSFGLGTGFYGSHSAVGVGQSIGSGAGDRVLRLVFGADNKLATWSKNY